MVEESVKNSVVLQQNEKEAEGSKEEAGGARRRLEGARRRQEGEWVQFCESLK